VSGVRNSNGDELEVGLGSLMVQAKEGNQCARDGLFERLQRLVRCAVRHQLFRAIRNQLDPDDVSQEVLAEVFQHLHELDYRGEEALHCWLGKVVKGHVVRHARGLRRRAICFTDLQSEDRAIEEGGYPAFSPSSNASACVEDAAETEDAAYALVKGVLELPLPARCTVCLLDFEGGSQRSAARCLGSDLPRVQRIHDVAVCRLRRLVFGSDQFWTSDSRASMPVRTSIAEGEAVVERMAERVLRCESVEFSCTCAHLICRVLRGIEFPGRLVQVLVGHSARCVATSATTTSRSSSRASVPDSRGN
jgi:DNA-directed RNA polymerase specialized sigma24 family protein